MFWWVVDYYLTNQYGFFNKNIQYFFNNLLSNPLNKYHPVLFFSSYIFFYNINLYTNYFTNFRNFNNARKYQYTNYLNLSTKVNIYWLVISFSLYLGSWWAIQEGSWGGWWNWDASEVFGLIILTLLLVLFHLKLTPNFLLTWLLNTYYFSLVIMFVYTILQMSYSLVSHNFGLSLIGYGYVNAIFKVLLITSICLTCVVLLRVYKNYINIFNKIWHINFILSRKNFIDSYINLTYIITLLLSVSILYTYLISFNPIINNIFYTSFSLEVFNNWLYWFDFKIIIFIITLLIVTKFNSLTLLISFFFHLFSTKHIMTFMFYFSQRMQYSYVLHIMLVLLFFTSTQLNNTVYSSWSFITESWNSTLINYTRSVIRNNFFLENMYIVNTVSTLHGNNSQIVNSFFFFTTSIDSQFFELDLNTNLLRQVMYSNNFLYLFKVTIYDIASLSTDLIVIVLTVLLCYLFVTKIKIIF